jgi:hypothetical protein
VNHISSYTIGSTNQTYLIKRLWRDRPDIAEQAIADEIGVTQKTIDNWLVISEKFPELLNPPESRQHFDVWNFSCRKELYEILHPQTKHGAIGGGHPRDAESATLNFVKDTADKTGNIYWWCISVVTLDQDNTAASQKTLKMV